MEVEQLLTRGKKGGGEVIAVRLKVGTMLCFGYLMVVLWSMVHEQNDCCS